MPNFNRFSTRLMVVVPSDTTNAPNEAKRLRMSKGGPRLLIRTASSPGHHSNSRPVLYPEPSSDYYVASDNDDDDGEEAGSVNSSFVESVSQFMQRTHSDDHKEGPPAHKPTALHERGQSPVWEACENDDVSDYYEEEEENAVVRYMDWGLLRSGRCSSGGAKTEQVVGRVRERGQTAALLNLPHPPPTPHRRTGSVFPPQPPASEIPFTDSQPLVPPQRANRPPSGRLDGAANLTPTTPPTHFGKDLIVGTSEWTAAACRSLSLHDAFFLSEALSIWMVDDRVLAKCLEYVGLMGYEHPLLQVDRKEGRPSMWSNTASLTSPLVPARPPPEGFFDATTSGPGYRLATYPPTCVAETADVSPLFLSYAEALRWVREQEYVIGVILLCCARPDGDGPTSQGSFGRHPAAATRTLGCIPTSVHPIHWAVQYIRENSQWSDWLAFTAMWETQVRLVLGTAAPTHQRTFASPDMSLVFTSDFEGGNLFRVESGSEPYLYYVWLEPDAGSDKRIWFRFAVRGMPEGYTLRIRLMNAAPHTKLYQQNRHTPVWRDGASQFQWTPVDTCVFRTTSNDLEGEIAFSIVARSPASTIQIAFSPPYTYSDLLCHICQWHQLVKSSRCMMRFEERVLCHTPDGRKLHLLIVTSFTNSNSSGRTTKPQVIRTHERRPGKINNYGRYQSNDEDLRGPYANFSSGKKVILISGRVHPGEVTASHGLHGIMSFLLSSDARAAALRENFLFFIVPMLNPDGVSRGYSRLDQYGNNLNRCYNSPDPVTQPTVHALRRVFEHLQKSFQERFIMYVDFHSHASQSSGFMFGNQLPSSVHHWNLFFPKLVELHAWEVFSYALCRFGRRHMTSKDGASRVLFGSSLIHSYTVELTHFTDCQFYADTFAAMNNGGSVIYDEAAGCGLRGLPNRSPLFVSHGDRYFQAPEFPRAKGKADLKSTKVRKAHRKDNSVLKASGDDNKSAEPSAEARGSTNTDARSGKAPNHNFQRRKNGGRWGTIALERLTSPSLQPLCMPAVLCQSALVGRACLLSLLDYCSVGGHQSGELSLYGGIKRVLIEAKHTIKQSQRKQRPPPLPIEPAFKQY